MTKIILTVTEWLIKKAGLLILLVLALSLAPPVKDAWRIVVDFQPERVVSDVIRELNEIAPGKNSSKQELEAQFTQLKMRRDQKMLELDELELEKSSCILLPCILAKDAIIFRIDAEVEVISQALNYVQALTQGNENCQALKKISSILTQLQQEVKGLDREPLLFFFPRASEHKLLIKKIKQLEAEKTNLRNSCERYLAGASTFQVNKSTIQKNLDVKHAELKKFQQKIQSTQGQIVAYLKPNLEPALWLLLGLILTPIGFKIFTYYAMAPLATRIFDVQLMPSASGELKVLSASDYLQKISLKQGEEFLFDPAAFRSASFSALKSTKYALDWSMPLTSIACGMYLLTMIRFDTEGVVEVAYDNVADGDSLKITVLEIPENSSLVLKPRCLVGIIQNTNHPIKITRHWRLASLASWLTLQLRYVVFHGPTKLVLKGNKGVSIEPSDVETNLKQSATLGFSTNLNYSVRRFEPFYPYFSGKHGLFNDRFSGRGFYLHEVGLGKRSNGPLRALSYPFELLWDVFTKSMGI